jgi:hypothetical protein
MKAKLPTSMIIPDSKALMGLGAAGWASGSHMCKGATAASTPNPTKIRIIASAPIGVMVPKPFTKFSMFNVPARP